MQIEDDEILQGFIEESLEHLADIENDLLEIEEGGENIDEDLVNKVFRAAHSIKGGAGFMGLTVIQDLAHAMENVLGLIRSCKLVPTPEVINVLLQSSDKLNTMIEDVNNSNDYDIEEHVVPLDAIYKGDTVPPVAAATEETSTPVEAVEDTASEVESPPVLEAEPQPEPEPEPEPEPVAPPPP
jgi:two-component system chemotaxis sensor kinase CheA